MTSLLSRLFLSPLPTLSLGLLLLFTGVAIACEECCGNDRDDIDAEVSTSACVQGTVRADITASGGGYTPPGAPSPQTPGPRTVQGTSPSSFNYSPRPGVVQVTPGTEYTVDWQKVGTATVNSLHTRIQPKNLPSGYKVQIDNGDGKGWRDQNHIDHAGNAASNPAAVTHKFRIVAPPSQAGKISGVMRTDTRFKMQPVATLNTLGQIATNTNGDSLPDYDLASAKVSMNLGAMAENDVPVSAGTLVFRSAVWVPNLTPFTITPNLLSYEGPTNTTVEVITTGTGNIRQIKAPDILADVVTISGTKFEVRMYAPADIGAATGPGLPYAVSGEPVSKAVFERLGSFSVSPHGSFPYGVRVTRFEHGAQVSQTDLGGRYTIANSFQRFIDIRRQDGEVVSTENNILFYQVGFPITVGSFSYTVTDSPVFYRDETRETRRDGQLVAETQDRYLLHSIGGWGASALGGFGDLLLTSRKYYGTSADAYELVQQWPNTLIVGHSQLGPFEAGAFGKPAFILHPDGGWTRYFYNANGQVRKTLSPYKGFPSDPLNATDSNCIVETFDAMSDPFNVPSGTAGYASTPAYEEALKDLDGTYEKKINGVTVAKTQNYYTQSTLNGHPVLQTTRRSYFSASGYVDEVEETYHRTALETLRGKPASVIRPTGERITYDYETGDFDTDTRVFTPSPIGLDTRRSATQGTDSSPAGIYHKTTRELTITGADGKLHQQSTQVFTGGTNYDTATMRDYFFDEHGDVIRVEKDDRVIRESHHHGLTAETFDESGIERTTVRDTLGRTLSETKTGGPSTIFIPNGPTTTIQSGGLTRVSVSDLAGRAKSETDETGATTSYSYPVGGRDRVVNSPGNLQTRATNYPGGMSLSETNDIGAKLVERYFTHSVIAGGDQTTRVTLGTSNSPRWSETTEDWLGRTKARVSPAPSGSGSVTTTIAFNASGLPSAEIPSAGTALKPKRYEYDSLGRVVREGIDHNSNNVLDPDSGDRITEFDQRFEKLSGHWYSVDEVREYRTDDNGTPTTVSVFKNRLHGSAGGFAAHTISTNADGLTVETFKTIDRANKTVVTTTTSSDATGTSVQTHVNGLLLEEKSPTSHLTHGYDALERLETTTNHRTGAVKTRIYDPATGQIESLRDHLNNSTSYFYHPATHKNAGQIKEIKNARLKSQYFDYNDRSQQTHTWGAATHPAKRTHAIYGEIETLTTYRGGTGWDGTTWPSGNEGTGDVTTWQYFVATGRLQFKLDAQNRKTSYTWRDNGRVNVRTWERGVTSTHSYDGAGLLTGITYSDATPAVTITRHRTGEANTLTDAAGLHTYAYTAAGQPDTETITGSGSHSGITLDYSYGPNGIADTFTATAASSTLYQTERSFHPVSGLLDKIESGDTVADYRYHPDSQLVHQIAFHHNDQPSLVNSRSYDDLDRLKATTHFSAGDLGGGIPMNPLAYAGYQHDELHRRTHATDLDGSYWHHHYNDRSEVQTTDKKLSDGTPMAGKQYRHDFDNIGNITSKETGGDDAGDNRRTFTTPANSLNQYSGYASPATFDVLGTAPGSPAVTVNGDPATYQGDHFRAEVTASNANTNGDWKAVTVISGGNTEIGHRFVAPATFTPEFDVDGNLTDDGEWNYAWDAENRLITMTRTTRAQTAGAPYRRVGLIYDAQHRCVERREYHTSGGTVVKTERYLYDGWNRVATLNAANQPQQRFTWGTDLSGGMQGAGGVGGLLWIEDVPTATVHLVCMDGNGNVTALVNAATKQPTARYDYGPFGDLLRQSGPYAAANPYRFSTKPQDPVTRLLYYGYRWFKPDWNTWTSRDPIEEEGGINLYGFVGNDGVNAWDYLGLVDHRIEIITNEGNIIQNMWGGIGDYGQPGPAAHPIKGGDMCETVVSGVGIVGTIDGKAYCNSVINERSQDASAVMIYSKAENDDEVGCKYEIYFAVRIQGKIAIDGKGGRPGIMYNVSATGGKSLSATASRLGLHEFDKSDILVATICMAKDEQKSLNTKVSVVTTGKGRATGQQMVRIIASKKIGKCDE